MTRAARSGGILVTAPFALPLRNFLPSGLAAALEDELGLPLTFVSPFPAASFADPSGRTFPNLGVRSSGVIGGIPQPLGEGVLDRTMRSVHLTGFSIEYPDGSLVTRELSARRNASWVAARLLTAVAPRASRRRDWLRAARARFRPRRAEIAALFDRVAPALVVVPSPGHFVLDQFVLEEAARRGVPTACIVLSWDNLYSRGPLIRRPDRMIVWSEEMRRQAVDVHQYPADRLAIGGPLQFTFYADPVRPDEGAAMRARLGLAPDEPYLAYVCGARTSTYDVEDVGAMLDALAGSALAGLRVVVRPHPQGDRSTYAALRERGVLLDASPDLAADGGGPDAFDLGAVRHMAALLHDARFVVSSWGTTALLEACVFDRPAVQLRWMDAVPHSRADEVQKVRDFQRYLHMRPFDASGARPYCDRPAELPALLLRMEEEREAFAERRRAVVARLTALPLEAAVPRICAALRPLLPGARSLAAARRVPGQAAVGAGA